ncbi:MAG: hypothetical protein CL483_00685 [Acidobacteria bacterium]|nr:hypothetical protein [Acidobacteriota bacterium]
MSLFRIFILVLLSPLLVTATVLYVPVLLVGVVIYMLRVLGTRGRVSGTAYEPLQVRLIYHLRGTRPDPVALELTRHLPATSWGFAPVVMTPFVWICKLFPGLLRYPPPKPATFTDMMGVRCKLIDDALEEHVANGDQVVLLGAGWDVRGYDRPADQAVPWFEVDTAATQAVKRAAVDAAGLDTSGITYVTCNLTEQAWLEALHGQGYDRTRRTFVIWEGVSMYLNDDAIAATLRAVVTLPAGSRVAFDLLTRQWLNTKAGLAAGRSVSGFYGEPWTWGLELDGRLKPTLDAYVEAQGLTVDRAWPLGIESDNVPAIGAVVLAAVPKG